MAISRYNERFILENSSMNYLFSSIFGSRGVDKINHYITPNLQYPSSDEIAENLILQTRVWTVGTKYFNLANEFYGEPQYWWVIAWFNLRPLETDFKPGDVVTIPLPLQSILGLYGYL